MAPPASAAPLPGSSYDSQDGDQVTQSAQSLDWQSVAPQAFLSTNLDNQGQDNCFGSGTETNPDSWTFTTMAGGCRPTKSDLLGMWTHSEITTTHGFLHAAFVRAADDGNSFVSFELNQKNTTWVNSTGTTIPCRSTGDILIGYELGSTVKVTIYRWIGDGSGPAACPNGARGTFQASAAANNGRVNSATITNYLSPSTIATNLGKASTDHTLPIGLFGEAQIEVGPILESMGVTGCYSFVSAQAHTRSSSSITDRLVDYLPTVSTQVANCTVTGTVHRDDNNNGSRETGEGGAAGQTAFVDLDNDKTFDANEPSDTTDAQGFFYIPTNLTSGTHDVRIVVPPNSLCTSPAPCSYSRTFTNAGTNAVLNDFGIYFFTPPQNTWAPSISGTVKEGSTLTADRGLWNGTDPISYAYQWLRCDAAGNNCVNIGGATDQSYTPSPADLNKTIRVRVTGTNMMGSSSAVSAQTSSITPRVPVSTSPPTISGTPQEASTLTANPGNWTGTAPINFAYRWRRCDAAGAGCVDIAGATAQTYNLVVADIGRTVRVRVTATNAAGTPVAAESAQTAIVRGRPPVNSVAPTVAGNPQEASTLIASPGNWTGTLPIGFTYQWARCDIDGASCSDIGGATGQAYALVPADVGSTVRVRVTGANIAGSSSAESDPTDAIAARTPNSTGVPTISGTPQEGATLTASPGTWTGTQPITYEYQWRRCAPPGVNCVDIEGAESQTYDLVPGDVGNTIRVRVTATNAADTPVSEQSVPTAIVQGRGAKNLTLPTISGLAQDGQTLTADPGTWEGTQPIDFTYQWLRCNAAGNVCADIDGATNLTYGVIPADVGGTLRVRVTATNIVGASAARSNATSLADAVPPSNTDIPLIFGNPVEASTLTADPGAWIGTEPIDFAYQWQRCDTAGANCVVMGGAASKTYDLVPDDIGSTIRVRVTATNLAGIPVDAQSQETVVIDGRSPSNAGPPEVTGTPEEASTLTADPGTWEGTQPIDLTYRWLRCDADGDDCVGIDGATNLTYDLVPADVGGTISVRVTATNVAGMEAVRASATPVIVGRPPANSAAPSITGTPQEASTLTAGPGTWEGTQPIDFAYQWLRCNAAGASCIEIDGATSQGYDLVPADVAATIRVRVTATNIVGTPISAESPETVQISGRLPANSSSPAISGNPQENSTLSASPGTWTGTQPIALAYQWLRCANGGGNCSEIAGATSQTYKLVLADVGGRIRVRVTATNVAGSASVQSSPTTSITARPPANVAVPTISGNPREGFSLSANPGTWTGTQPIAFAYQWLRCETSGAGCVAIPSATSQSYALVPADIGSTIRIRVTGTNASSTPVSAQSAQTVPITGRAPVNTQLPTISGAPLEGTTLTATEGDWTGTAPINFTYQWLRCNTTGSSCQIIPAATASRYLIVPSDAGSALRVRVTATNLLGDVSVESAATAPVGTRAPINDFPPSISGNPEEGSSLIADSGTWLGTEPIYFAYHWQRCDLAGANCVAISGANQQTYLLTPADIGKTIRIRVTGANVSGEPGEARSGQTATITGRPPVNNSAPIIMGSFFEGRTVTADPGTWNGTQPIGFTYRWRRCDAAGANCVDIAGATSKTYDLVPADIGRNLSVRVTASNVIGTAVAQSASSPVIAARPPVNGALPTISGNAQEGATLTAHPGIWSGTQPINLAYQWLRCDPAGANCAAIGGATGQTYSVLPADIALTIRVRITATNVSGMPVSADSAKTNQISGRAPANTALPTISGNPEEGSTLTANGGSWSGTQPISLTYQWLRCNTSGDSCVDISNETGQSYQVVAGDGDDTLRVRVTAANVAGTIPADSAPTAPIGTRAPANDTGPTISGDPKELSTLTADPGTWTGTAPIDFTYQWLRCDVAGAGCAEIGGATGQTYDLVDPDVGSTIRIRVTATNISGNPVSAESVETAEITGRVPVNATAPAITGNPRESSTLTANPGAWTGTQPIDFTYQWLRCDAAGANCAPVAGATSQTYDLVLADIGSRVRVRVTASNVAGSANANSPATSAVAARAPANAGVPPTIMGDTHEGSTLTADPGTWIGTAPIDFTYQWLRCDAAGANCAAIPGATGTTYDLTGDDVGRQIRVSVTATNPGGSAAQRSDAQGPVGALPSVNTVLPSFSGMLEVGQTLTGDPGEWSGAGPFSYGFQWLRCDDAGENCVAIPRATDETYVLQPADENGTIRLQVTATNPGGSVDAVSAPQGPVTIPEQPGPDPAVCQRAPAPTAMSFAMPGVGVMRFRVAPTGDQITRATPLVASSTKRFTQVGQLDSLLSAVVYRLDRHKIAVARRAPYRLVMPLGLLSRGKRHVLTVTAITRTGTRSKVNVPFRTAPCITQFIANYRASSRRGALRLRVDNKLPIQRVTFFTPRALLPRATANTSSGLLRVLFGSAGRSVYRLGFGRPSARRGTVLRAPGTPRVQIARRRVTVTSLPASTGMLKLELVRRGSNIRILRGPATLAARVTTAAGTETLRMTIGPRVPR